MSINKIFMHISALRKKYTLRELAVIAFISCLLASLVPLEQYFSPKIIITANVSELRIFYDDGDRVLIPHYSPKKISTRADGYFDITYSLPSAEIDKLLLKPDLRAYRDACIIQRITITGAGSRKLYEFSDNALRKILVPINHISNVSSSREGLFIDVLGDFPLLGIDFSGPIRQQSIAGTIRHYHAEIFFIRIISKIALLTGIVSLLFWLRKRLERIDLWGTRVFQSLFSTTFRSFGVLLICLSGIGIYVFYDFITLKKPLLYYDIASDTVYQIWPFMLQFMERLHQNGGLFWSFRLGIGTPTPAFEHFYGLYNPLNALFYMVSREDIPYIFAFVLMLKILLGGLGWFFFLRKIKIHPFVAVIMSVLYAYSGYTIGSGSWIWGTANVAILPYVFLALECFIQDRRWYYFPMAIAWYGVSSSGWIELFQAALWCFIYFGIRYCFLLPTFNLKRSLRDVSIVAGLFLLGLCFIAVILFPQIQYLFFERVREGSQPLAGSFHEIPIKELVLAWFRTFSNDLLGTPGQNSISGFAPNYFGVPLLYNGLMTLVLVISLFVFGTRKIKWAAAISLLLGILLLISPQFRSLFWGGQFSYYRTVCLYHAFAASLFASIAFNTFLTQPKCEDKNTRNSIVAIGLGICCLFIVSVNILHAVDKTVILDRGIVKYTYWSILLYSLLLTLIALRKYVHITLVVLLLAVCCEAGTSAWRTLNYKRKIASARYCTNQELENTLAELSQEDVTFYRLEKSFYTCGMNDPMFQNYYGMSSYVSLNSPPFMKFLQHVSHNVDHLRLSGRDVSPLVKSLLGIKYHLSYRNGVQRSYNEYYIPLGSFFDKIITEEHFQALPQELRELVLLQAVVLDRETASLPEFQSFETIDSHSVTKESALLAARDKQKTALAIQEFKSDSIKGTLSTPRRQILFFSIPSSAGWQLFINNQRTPLHRVDFGLMAAIVEPGDHTIRVLFTPPFFTLGGWVSFGSVVVFSVILIGQSYRAYTRKTLRGKMSFVRFILLALLLTYVFGYFFLWFRSRHWPAYPKVHTEYTQQSRASHE